MIYETIVTTLNSDGEVHVAPMGIRDRGGRIELAPFRPSTTLENLRREQAAVVNFCDDVRIFAGCLTGRRRWATRSALRIQGAVIEAALGHVEVQVERLEEDPVRPRFFCKKVEEATHSAFRGFNRAQAAVIEAAILVSRLHMLPADKVDREMEYLQIAVEKTAGPREREAWGWLNQRLQEYREEGSAPG